MVDPEVGEERGSDAVVVLEQTFEQVDGFDLRVPRAGGTAYRARDRFLALGGELNIHVFPLRGLLSRRSSGSCLVH